MDHTTSHWIGKSMLCYRAIRGLAGISWDLAYFGIGLGLTRYLTWAMYGLGGLLPKFTHSFVEYTLPILKGRKGNWKVVS